MRVLLLDDFTAEVRLQARFDAVGTEGELAPRPSAVLRSLDFDRSRVLEVAVLDCGVREQLVEISSHLDHPLGDTATRIPIPYPSSKSSRHGICVAAGSSSDSVTAHSPSTLEKGRRTARSSVVDGLRGFSQHSFGRSSRSIQVRS